MSLVSTRSGSARSRAQRRYAVPLLVVLVVALAACNPFMDHTNDFSTAGSYTVTGTAPTVTGDTLVAVTVNGAPATLTGSKYSLQIQLDGSEVFNQVVVLATYQSGHVETERGTVVYGDGTHATIVAYGAAVNNGVALRMNQQAFAKLGPVVQSLTTIDTTSITPVGTSVLNQCVVSLIVCITSASATIDRAPTLGGFNVNLISHAGSTEADVTLHNLVVTAKVNTMTAGLISIPCELRITASSVVVKGNYVLKPDTANPEQLRVDLKGSPAVSLSGVGNSWIGGVCSLPVIDTIVSLLMPNVQTLMQTNLTKALSDPDGSGPKQSPIAVAIQQSLAKVNIAGPIGTSLGVNLKAPFSGVTQDANGIGLTANSTFLPTTFAPGAPPQVASVGFGNPTVANPGTKTPSGKAYDVAVGASITSFNQLLAGETDRGLLNLTVTTVNGQALTLNGLLGLPPGGDAVQIVLAPETAPAITTAVAPTGSIGVMHIGGYRATITDTVTNSVLLEMVLDFDAPVNLVAANGQLGFVLTAPPAASVHIDITKNPLAIPPALVQSVFAGLEPGMFAQIGTLLPAFPLPQLVGLTLAPVETARVGDSLFLYANLT